MDISKFEQQKQASLSHSLIKAGRLINELGLTRVREQYGLDRLTQRHLDLFAHISFEGSTVNEIAQSQGISKQAVSKTVQEMIEMDLLYSTQDPNDGRSKKIHFYQKGPKSISQGFRVLMGIDEMLEEQLGANKPRQLQKSLASVIQLLE